MENKTNPQERPASRLPYPPPPEVRVKISQTQAADLDRLCSSTGQSPGEVAAVLLAEYLVLDPAQPLLQATAQKLRALHWERRRELQDRDQALLTTTRKNPPGRPASKAGSVRIPLSNPMNGKLYELSVDSGLTRAQIAQILLKQANLNDMADQIEQAASAVVEVSISNQTVS